MSRHRKLIYDEDYGDYDYDDYEDEDISYPSSTDPPEDYVQYVASSLRDLKKPPPAATILRKLEELNYNTKSTIDFFRKQTKASSAPTTKPKAQTKALAVKGLEKQGAAKTAGNNPVKISPPVASTSKLDSHQLATDLQGLGFHEAKSSAEETRADGNISDDDPDLNFTRGGGLPNLNVIVTGHVDSGKSTLVGHLLYKKGTISQRMVHKFEKESNALGKGSFYLAWIMDETESERDHGVTIDVTRRVFTTPSKHITILDSPGHKDFMPNMISGCSAADVALLVVPASPGEFESCMMLNAQTREHAIILKSMGVNQVLVAVNKMDLTLPLPWSQARYNFIVENVVKLLTELSFARKAIRFVPVSGLTGENLVDMSPTVASALEWYRGGTLADAFDAYKVPPRVIDKPLRAVINSVLSLDNYGTKKSAEVEVTVLQGRLRLNRQVAIASSEIVEVKGIYVNGTPADTLFAGDQGVITFAPRKGTDCRDIFVARGIVIVKGNPIRRAVQVFKATLLTMGSLVMPIIPGSSFELYAHGEELECHVVKIYSMTLPSSGAAAGTSELPANTSEVLRPKCVGAGRQAKVKIRTNVPIYVEAFEDCKSLGRVALRTRGVTVAVGVVTRA